MLVFLSSREASYRMKHGYEVSADPAFNSKHLAMKSFVQDYPTGSSEQP